MSDPTSKQAGPEVLISARAVARRRKPFLGKALLLLAALLALSTIIMATQVSWSELSEARTAMRQSQSAASVTTSVARLPRRWLRCCEAPREQC